MYPRVSPPVKARILINAKGGSVSNRRAIERAIGSAGIAGEVEWIEGGDIAQSARAAVADGADTVVAGGGDGTISAVAGAVAGTRTKLGILPLGTLNHFARDLSIPLDVGKAAKLVASAAERRVDVAEVNGRVFVNNSAIGVYPLMVIDRKAQQRRLGRSKRLAMAVAAARTLASFSSRRLTLTLNDRKAHVDTPLLFVGNNSYRLEMPDAGTRERLDSGELFVLVLRRTSRLGFCLATIRALAGRSRAGDSIKVDGVKRLRVDSPREELVVSLDGETVHLEPPLAYRIRPKALRVIAP